MIASRLRSLALVPALTVLAGACGSDPEGGGAPPGIACTGTQSAGDAASARAALAAAGDGACVVLTGGTYEGPFEVPAGRKLVAGSGARATITGGTASAPAVLLSEGAALAGVDVLNAGGVGVAVRAASATISDVKVTGAKSAALAVLCKEGCDAGQVELTGVTLEKSTMGLWVSGARVRMKGGRSAEHTSQSLSAAAGVVAQGGAHLDLDGVTVEKNQGVGVLVDGENTTASIVGATVSENAERGVWAQRVSGTLDAPALRVESSTIAKNRIVGLGGVEARGIIIVGGRVADTVAAPVATDLATTEQVGDGVGLFSGTGDVKLDNLTLEANARAAGLVDAGNAGIIIVGGKIAPGASGLKFVVQNTTAEVQLPADAKSEVGERLGVSAPKLSVPAVLP